MSCLSARFCLLLLLATSWLAVPGCMAGGDACQSEADCYRGELCEESRCVEIGTGPLEGGGWPSCVTEAGPVDGCVQEVGEPNDQRSSSAPLFGERLGCNLESDVLQGVDGLYEGQLCPGDPGDFFGLWLSECEGRDFFVTIEVVPTLGCHDSLVDIGVYWNGARLDCQEDVAMLRCAEIDGVIAGERFVVRVPAQTRAQLFNLHVGLTPAPELPRELRLRYEIRYHVDWAAVPHQP